MNRFLLLLLSGLVCQASLAAERWEPIVEPYGQLFPAIILATSTMTLSDEDADPSVLGDPNSYVGVRISAAKAGEVVDVVVRSPNLMAETRERFVLARAGTEYELYPTLQWNFERLKRQTQTAPESLNFEVFSAGASLGARTQRVRLRSINDVPFAISDGEEDGETIDLNWLFAAYVNEDHPIVDEILRDALETGIVDSFDGYQSGEESRVYEQVYAIWRVLQQRGIRYSSITRTANEDPNISSQHVRLIDQSIKLKQANCVDGTVLFASILRKIDIAPFLVMVPGHMFLGFYLDEAQEIPTFLETTLLGSVKPAQSARLQSVGRALDQNIHQSIDAEQAWNSFEAAVEEGNSQVEEAADKFDSDDPDYQFIDIQSARELGVVPISS